MRVDEFSIDKLRESHAAIQELSSLHKYRSYRQTIMNYSRDFQDVESICSGKIIPRSQSTSNRSKSWWDAEPRRETWNLLGTSGNVFDSPRAVIDSSPSPYQGMLHSLSQSATGEKPVRENTGKPVARSGERNQETVPSPRFARRPSTMN